MVESDDLAWDTDGGLRLTFVSIDAARRLGLDALSLLGQPLTALFTLDSDGDGALPILEAVARQRPLERQRARVRGGDVRVLLTAHVRRDPSGQFAGLSGIARVEDEAPAPASPSTIAPAFTEGLDKALRTPLARIIAHADTIHAEAEGPVQRDYADYASDIANAGRHLLTRRRSGGSAGDRAARFRAGHRFDRSRRRRAPRGGAALRPREQRGRRDRAAAAGAAHAGAGRFRRALQIMVNLVGNAVRYSPEGGVVSVTALRTGSMAEAVVADQGKGIAIEDQARIFEKFERVDPTEAGGNGLGLYIARRLARAMGGDLTVESAPGEGARFTLSLPV